MYTTDFDYARATSVDEVISLLQEHGSGAKLLAGGHSLLPSMKLRLAQPSALIDISELDDLAYIREDGDQVRIGALTTHRMIEQSDLVRRACPALAALAEKIGDPQVRNRGTIGGSLAHADAAADYPAMILALDADLDVVGPSGSRTVNADDFFTGMFETAVGANEMLTEVRVSSFSTGMGASYAKFENQASRYAVVGVAARIQVDGHRCVSARVGVTGAASVAFRAENVEQDLIGTSLDDDAISAAVTDMVDPSDLMEDLSGSQEYRAHLCEVMAERAISEAADRVKAS